MGIYVSKSSIIKSPKQIMTEKDGKIRNIASVYVKRNGLAEKVWQYNPYTNLNWISRCITIPETFYEIKFLNNVFIAMTGGHYFSWSGDGINWNMYHDESVYFRDVCYAEEKFVFLIDSCTTYKDTGTIKCRKTTDFIEFEEIPVVFNAYRYIFSGTAIEFFAGNYIVFFNYDTSLAGSTTRFLAVAYGTLDNLTIKHSLFFNSSGFVGQTQRFVRRFFFSDRLIAQCFQNGSNQKGICINQDGTVTEIVPKYATPASFFPGINGFVYENIFYLFSSSKNEETFVYSLNTSDGLAWEYTSAKGNIGPLVAVIELNAYCLGIYFDGRGALFSSVDELLSTNPEYFDICAGYNLYDMAMGKNCIVAVGKNGTIFTSEIIRIPGG